MASALHHAFWHTAKPQQQIERLAFYRAKPAEDAARVVFVAAAGPWVTLGMLSDVDALRTVGARYCPYEIEPPVVFADPAPRECRAFLRRLFAPALSHGSWYHREPLETLLSTLASHPAPPQAPGLPELPQRLRDFVPQNPYQESLLRNECLAYLRGHLA